MGEGEHWPADVRVRIIAAEKNSVGTVLLAEVRDPAIEFITRRVDVKILVFLDESPEVSVVAPASMIRNNEGQFWKSRRI
jgi:hypothetical protein